MRDHEGGAPSPAERLTKGIARAWGEAWAGLGGATGNLADGARRGARGETPLMMSLSAAPAGPARLFARRGPASPGEAPQPPTLPGRARAPNPVMDLALSGAVTREDLGRSTWTLLHTLAAQLPEKPTKQQQRDVKDLINCLTRIYPCGECADHFKNLVKSDPPVVSSGFEFSQWLCRVHNVVNRRLDKPVFNCTRVDARWGKLECGEEGEDACSLESKANRGKPSLA